MEALATAISTAVTPSTLFAAVAPLAPVIVAGLLVGFTLSIARKTIGGLGHGKAKI